MQGLSEGLPVTVSLGETNEHPYAWIDCVVRLVDGRMVALAPREQLSPRMGERLAEGERGYVMFEDRARPIALPGVLRLSQGRLEFLVLERSVEARFQAALQCEEPLLRLMYVSQAATGLREADFYAILRESSERNQANRLTGALCLHGNFFGQILEGPEPAVRETLARIELDTRHSEPIVLFEEQAQHRLYGGWAMRGIQAEGALSAADELAARLALASRGDSAGLTRRWLELLKADGGPGWREAWLSEGRSVLVFRELVEQSAPLRGRVGESQP